MRYCLVPFGAIMVHIFWYWTSNIISDLENDRCSYVSLFALDKILHNLNLTMSHGDVTFSLGLLCWVNAISNSHKALHANKCTLS